MFEGILNQIGQGALSAGQGFANFAQNNSQALLAASAGLGKGSPMGNMSASVYDHFAMQDKIKRDQADKDELLEFKREALRENSRLAADKIAAHAAKAAQSGKMPKKIMSIGGVATMMNPDGSTFTIEDEKVQHLYEQAQEMKLHQAELAANQGMQKADQDPTKQKNDAAQSAAADSAEAGYAQFEKVKKLHDDNGGISLISRMAPNEISQTVNRVFGTVDGKIQKGLAAVNMTSMVDHISKFPGALSDKDVITIKAALERIDDSPEMWSEFFATKGPLLEAAMKKVRAQEQARKAESERIQSLPSYSNGGAKQAYPGKAGKMLEVSGQAEAQAANVQLESLKAEVTNPAYSAAQKAAARDKLLAFLNSAEKNTQDGVAVSAPTLPDAPEAPKGATSTFTSAAEVQAAIKAGTLKSGDFFLDPSGKKRQVK